jgi:hypothetical protein
MQPLKTLIRKRYDAFLYLLISIASPVIVCASLALAADSKTNTEIYELQDRCSGDAAQAYNLGHTDAEKARHVERSNTQIITIKD